MATEKETKLTPTDELAKIELENKRMEMEERRLRLEDMRNDIDQKKLARQNNEANWKSHGIVLEDQERTDGNRQAHCSHKKGGIGMQALIDGGDDNEYAVWKMKWFDGKMWVRCLRCGNTWKPVRLAQFTEAKNMDGTLKYATAELAKEAFDIAAKEYKEACAFPTKNQPSGTIQFRYEDTERYNRIMDNINLR